MSWLAGRHGGGMGFQNVFCIRSWIQPQSRYRFHKGSLSPSAIIEISIPNTPSSWSSFCISVLWLGTFGRDVIFLPEELTISCWISCKEIWKIKFWSTCPWIITICRIRTVAVFSFAQLFEGGVKIENTSQFKTVLLEYRNLKLSKLIQD